MSNLSLVREGDCLFFGRIFGRADVVHIDRFERFVILTVSYYGKAEPGIPDLRVGDFHFWSSISALSFLKSRNFACRTSSIEICPLVEITTHRFP